MITVLQKAFGNAMMIFCIILSKLITQIQRFNKWSFNITQIISAYCQAIWEHIMGLHEGRNLVHFAKLDIKQHWKCLPKSSQDMLLGNNECWRWKILAIVSPELNILFFKYRFGLRNNFVFIHHITNFHWFRICRIYLSDCVLITISRSIKQICLI